MTHNRKNRIECRLQTFVFAFVVGFFLLQKFGIRIKLGGQQKRHFQYVFTLGKTFTDTLFLGKRISHGALLQK